MGASDRTLIHRAGRYYRVADPWWDDPLNPSFASRNGGRWNPPGISVLYLSGSVEVARANVDRLFVGLPYGPEDLDSAACPILVEVVIPPDEYVDAVTGEGLNRLGLPKSYPLDAGGRIVPHSACRPIGLAAYEDGEPGIACRSAAPGANGEELVWFALPERAIPPRGQARSFDEWFWGS